MVSGDGGAFVVRPVICTPVLPEWNRRAIGALPQTPEYFQTREEGLARGVAVFSLGAMKMIDIPPVWLLLFAVLAWGQARVWPVWQFGGWADWAGGLVIVLGLGLMAAAVLAFVRGGTSVIPRRAPAAILTTGVFGLTRNPIYLGDALVLLGLVLRWDAVLSLFLVPLFVWLIDRRFIRDEEARLRAAFPEDFADWSKRVRRWV